MIESSMCTVNVRVKDLLDKHNKGLKFEVKQSPNGIATDGPGCWPGLNVLVDLTLNEVGAWEKQDEHFLLNVAKLERIIPKEMWKSSVVGDWRTNKLGMGLGSG